MAQINRDSVVAALRNGFDQAQIAGAMGVTDSAISQFISEHGLAAVAAQNSQFKEHDNKLNALEESVLDKLAKVMNTAILDPIRLAAVYKTLNGAKRRSLAEGQTIQNINNVRLVSLNLPRHVEVKVGLNANNEVIEVEGRAINTLPAGKLVEMTQLTSKIKGSLGNASKPSIAEIL
jgi:predicted transcriptional regulator